MLKQVTKFVLWMYTRIMFKVEVQGIENLPSDRGYILCPNHINLSDPIVIGTSIDPYIHFMAKASLFKNPVLAHILRSGHVFPVDRDGNDIGAIKHSLKVLKNRQPLLMFAEGTRNKGVRPLEAKAGVAMIAAKAEVPIIPVMVDSSYRFRSRVIVRFMQPVELTDLYKTKVDSTIYQERTQEIMESIYDQMVLFKEGRHS